MFIFSLRTQENLHIDTIKTILRSQISYFILSSRISIIINNITVCGKIYCENKRTSTR